jgi:hypothetical protein
MQNDRNYYRLLNNEELIEQAKQDSELAVVLAERLEEALDEPGNVEDED